MRDITKIDNYSLLGHFEDAIYDKISTTTNDANQSGFLYEELYAEILRRLSIFAQQEKSNI